jgi:hypothetical protein
MESPTLTPSLRDVPDRVLTALDRADRGVVVLAVDGLAYAVAAEHWRPGTLDRLRSTVPSTSTTAWLTSVTGVGPERHGLPGMVFRLPADGTLVYAVSGTTLATGPADPQGRPGLLWPQPTVFQRAAARGVRCVALGREMDGLTGPWAAAVLAGCTRVAVTERARLAEQAARPLALVAGVTGDVAQVLATGPHDRPMLVWAYVNLDDYVHRHGYDDAARAALAALAEHAEGWTAGGWTVLAHADHGQVRCAPDPDLVRAFAAVDDPADCLVPAGGAGRIRWLYPKPGRTERVADRLADALGDAARVLPAGQVPELNRPGLAGRVGPVVAIAASPRFPVPDPALRYEHGGFDDDEMHVPFATWRP